MSLRVFLMCKAGELIFQQGHNDLLNSLDVYVPLYMHATYICMRFETDPVFGEAVMNFSAHDADLMNSVLGLWHLSV